jgi:acyl-CoA synthetase (AMP-forming)/AMP-acid ligase II
VLRDCGARIVVAIDHFADRDLLSLLRSASTDLPDLESVFALAAEGVDLPVEPPPELSGGDPAPLRDLFAMPDVRTLSKVGELERTIGSEAPVAIVYTSGTTGRPKGAVFALRNLEAVARTRGEMGTRPGDRVLTAGTPFAHIGYMTKILGHLEDRQTTVILDSFSARKVLETVATEKVTHLGGVPTQWALMLREPDFERFDLSSVRSGAIGGAPFTPELVREIRRRFRIDLVTRYSCTEIGLGTGSRPDDPEELLAQTVGRPGAEVELRIVDEERRSLRRGEVGEVAVRGPAVMIGYWNRPEETRAVLDEEGWFYTGDLGLLDEQGYLRLRGRKKEMYIRGGYNVYPVEVESVLSQHPDVAQIAVVGVPDPVLGEKGLAVIVPRDPHAALDPEAIRVFCREHLADYKTPDYVEIRRELPVNAMYKVDKRRLREDWKRGAG